jgi:hypothetical protein
MRQCIVHNVLWGTLILSVLSSCLNAQSKKTQAQNLVDLIAQKHSEISALELSATPAGQKRCVIIAATSQRTLREKCDQDEAAAMKPGPFVEQEPEGFDVTAPLHDATGKLIGALGIHFKQHGRTKANVLKLTAALLKELEQQIPSKAFLFQSVSAD